MTPERYRQLWTSCEIFDELSSGIVLECLREISALNARKAEL